VTGEFSERKAAGGEPELKRVLAEKTLEIDFFRACKKSRLDARAKVGLVGKCRGPNPGVDADARQLEYRADVRHGHGKSCGFLSFTERKDAIEEDTEVRSAV
jgi:hypothetical protein